MGYLIILPDLKEQLFDFKVIQCKLFPLGEEYIWEYICFTSTSDHSYTGEVNMSGED